MGLALSDTSSPPANPSAPHRTRHRRGRVILLAVADVVLFLAANVAYGGGHRHGLRNNCPMSRGPSFWSARLPRVDRIGDRCPGRVDAAARQCAGVVAGDEKDRASVRFSPMSEGARTD